MVEWKDTLEKQGAQFCWDLLKGGVPSALWQYQPDMLISNPRQLSSGGKDEDEKLSVTSIVDKLNCL